MPELIARIREKRYPGVGGAPPHLALRNLEVKLGEGEFIALVGPSGCGKTTFLNIVAGLDTDFEGEVRLASRPDGEAPRIGYVFQSPRLLPWRTVYENIALALRPEQDAAIVDELLEEMGLSAARNVYPTRLSGGMSRRVSLARAFAIEPDLLLMDEPFSSLDAVTAESLRKLLLRILEARPASALLVTHDLWEALSLADRILLLTHSPARVLADVPVRLPRGERADAQLLSDLYKEIEEAQRAAASDFHRNNNARA